MNQFRRTKTEYNPNVSVVGQLAAVSQTEGHLSSLQWVAYNLLQLLTYNLKWRWVSLIALRDAMWCHKGEMFGISIRGSEKGYGTITHLYNRIKAIRDWEKQRSRKSEKYGIKEEKLEVKNRERERVKNVKKTTLKEKKFIYRNKRGRRKKRKEK